jgi:hypothetical protein
LSLWRSVAESNKPDPESQENDERVEQLAKELADRLRAMPNRQLCSRYFISDEMRLATAFAIFGVACSGKGNTALTLISQST